MDDVYSCIAGQREYDGKREPVEQQLSGPAEVEDILFACLLASNEGLWERFASRSDWSQRRVRARAIIALAGGIIIIRGRDALRSEGGNEEEKEEYGIDNVQVAEDALRGAVRHPGLLGLSGGGAAGIGSVVVQRSREENEGRSLDGGSKDRGSRHGDANSEGKMGGPRRGSREA